MKTLPEFSIEGKKAIVTGAGRGIGKAIALTLAEAGVDVCVAARSGDELEAVAEEIRGTGRRAAAIPTDITDEASVAAMVEGALGELGEIDVLVNNAGIAVVKPLVPLPGLKPTTADNFPGFFEPYSTEEWAQVMDVNLRGAFLCMRGVGPHMLERGSGKVVNISSINAERAGRYRFTYDTSKAALNRMTKSVAVEWARHGVQVNAICATYVDTRSDPRVDGGRAPAVEDPRGDSDAAPRRGPRGRPADGVPVVGGVGLHDRGVRLPGRGQHFLGAPSPTSSRGAAGDVLNFM